MSLNSTAAKAQRLHARRQVRGHTLTNFMLNYEAALDISIKEWLKTQSEHLRHGLNQESSFFSFCSLLIPNFSIGSLQL